MTESVSTVNFGDDGLVPAAIQDGTSGELLMVGFMSREALECTRSTGYVHFWSRSRQKLWKKGESSGHVQRVQEIRVNCDLNSLLIEVEQSGAVCHDGYDTCFYRRLEPDDTLTIIRDRRFDPRDVYGSPEVPANGLAAITTQWWCVYEWLRDNDRSVESTTSRILHAGTCDHVLRLAGELRELAGVLDSTHRHTSFDADLRLEAGQVLYWTACTGVLLGSSWQNVRPDLALNTSARDHPDDQLLVKLLSRRAELFDEPGVNLSDALLHDTITLVATVATAHGIEPEELIQRDLEEMRKKPYLAGLFDT